MSETYQSKWDEGDEDELERALLQQQERNRLARQDRESTEISEPERGGEQSTSADS
jgi:hypothetical protein